MTLSRRRLLLAALSAPCSGDAQPVLRAWHGAAEPPPLRLRTLDGASFDLAQLRGKVVLVNFWATWCEPCVEEMPSMQRLLESSGGAGLEIVGVNFKEGEPRIRSFLQKVPVTFPLVRDTDGGAARDWKVRIFPSTFVLDRALRVRYSLVGSVDWTAEATVRPLRALLSG